MKKKMSWRSQGRLRVGAAAFLGFSLVLALLALGIPIFNGGWGTEGDPSEPNEPAAEEIAAVAVAPERIQDEPPPEVLRLAVESPQTPPVSSGAPLRRVGPRLNLRRPFLKELVYPRRPISQRTRRVRDLRATLVELAASLSELERSLTAERVSRARRYQQHAREALAQPGSADGGEEQVPLPTAVRSQLDQLLATIEDALEAPLDPARITPARRAIIEATAQPPEEHGTSFSVTLMREPSEEE